MKSTAVPAFCRSSSLLSFCTRDVVEKPQPFAPKVASLITCHSVLNINLFSYKPYLEVKLPYQVYGLYKLC